MKEIELRKSRLAQRKARLMKEEAIVRLNEKKVKGAHLMEIARLIAKLELDALEIGTLCGALVFVKETLIQKPEIMKVWSEIGEREIRKIKEMDGKLKHEKIPVIVKITGIVDEDTGVVTMDAKVEVDIEVKAELRKYGLKWNQLRKEWQGYVSKVEVIEDILTGYDFSLEVIREDEVSMN